ncbi:vascular endothelial growth factor receptor 2 isoform X3 [Pocillopora verrucosa]|uniref:vascular endothelial growth factor receptor 2 isoform X3 n=1 Tax=Pocillopora verrucosa TaxID=203993 RepID=UPI00333FDAC7
MMVNTFWRGDTTKVILLQVLVANSLLLFSSVTGDAATCNTKSVIPEVKIFTSPPNRTQPIAAAINLTCEAWPKHKDEFYPRRRVKYIQWYDTHGRQIGGKCLNLQFVKKLKCPLILKNLTIENFGNYTCEAQNEYAGYCTRKSVEILHKDLSPIDTTKAPHLLFPEVVENPKNQSVFIGSNVTFNCTAMGLPTPAISWMKNNDSYAVTSNVRARVVSDNKNNHSQLIITEVKIEDNGKYKCVASNSAGEKTSSAAFLYIKELDSKMNQETGKEKSSTSSQISFFTLSYAIIAAFAGVFIGGICVGF